MNSRLLASIVIIVAMALVGAAVVSNVPVVPKQAFADPLVKTERKVVPKTKLTTDSANKSLMTTFVKNSIQAAINR